MANRLFNQFALSMEKEVVHLYMRVTFGASGAPTITPVDNKCIASIVRNSAGQYLITLQDSYVHLLMANACSLSATAPAAPLFRLISENVRTTNSLVVQFSSTSDVATDPGSGEVFYLTLELRNSTAY